MSQKKKFQDPTRENRNPYKVPSGPGFYRRLKATIKAHQADLADPERQAELKRLAELGLPVRNGMSFDGAIEALRGWMGSTETFTMPFTFRAGS